MALYPIKLYLKYLPNLIILPLSLLLNIWSWVWLLIGIKPNLDPIFLHYNILFGVDYVGEWWRVFYLPLAGIIFLLLNFFLGWYFIKRDKFWVLLLNSGALLCQVFILISIYYLIYLNV